MNLLKITDHSDQAIDRLIQQFKDKEKIQGLVKSFVDPLQNIEDTIAQIGFYTNIFNATGKQLDLMGIIVGEPRKGRNDFYYRIGVITKIAINTSKGTPENAINIFSLLTGATIVNIFEFFPGHVEIFGNVNFQFGFNNLGPDSFAFDGGVDGLGFGDVFDPSIGGKFVGLIVYDVTALYNTMDRVLAAGVRIDHLGFFNDTPFSFEGDPKGLGFGDKNNSTVGGDFATII